MANFELLGFVHIAVGYQLFVYPFVHIGGWSYSGIEAAFIIAFLCYVTAFLLLCLIKFSSLKGNKAAIIATIVLTFVAGLATIIGVAMQDNRVGGSEYYGDTELCLGAILAIIGGVFLILTLCMGG